MSLHHLIYISILLVNFSGIPPVSNREETVIENRILVNDKEENEEFIPWLPERKLAWEDFYAEPKRNSEAVASTSTSLGISYQMEEGLLVYKITCNFSKQKSWGLLKTEYILAHEQGHFDITEIAARRLYAALQQYEFNSETYKQDINALYRIIVKDKENMQAEYDHITDHSRNRRLQREWQDKIRLMLDETQAWATYP